ncbi:helix-turn-helix transcriptional regulator [Achromobacter insolitus]|uniref:HTH cro/C1-type domain-containing protein n=1 Tax=Achromobacter insolitus TaxID=217204 RepID=A0A6S7F696_9BURK|nr:MULTISPECIES: helix-turn-helix transcriptional regulator [Achromobacter]AVG41665.1 XRE family transcriptional regulator [Achromobacter insolitus]MDH3062197.1 helix-turn-helix transcriptional regulator [Achromobacter insolitus]MDQ6213893.1 helix-turn-helix transcriptional regulator [Achromobacter insolitus]MEB3095294.1 helix-turn-helix transcriptional regulator [Achromobacter sp. D10]OAD17778.1 transcriptional regulator [Achromobacter insolitus]
MTTSPQTAAAGHEGSPLRRQALGEFVRSARSRITPQMAGLPEGMRRRTPGLRREEVAQLCGISVTWYTWIEQGREVSVSPSVWSRIAGVLQLARAERAYLFDLADCADPQHARDDAGAPGPLQECVNAINAPAYVLDRAWNVLAYNEPLRDLFDNWPARDAEPNLLSYIFLDPAARELVVDWDQRARRVVAEFRADAGAHLDESAVLALLDNLNRQSPVFAHWWTRHAVVEREGGLREFQHPRRGKLAYQQITFRLATHPDLKLVMLLGAGAEPADAG